MGYMLDMVNMYTYHRLKNSTFIIEVSGSPLTQKNPTRNGFRFEYPWIEIPACNEFLTSNTDVKVQQIVIQPPKVATLQSLSFKSQSGAFKTFILMSY